jgi:anti-sigma regulatory factor (Ser/Thr protein kinase)
MHDRLRHEALPYAGHEQFVSSVVTEVRDGLVRDERPILLAEQAKLDDVGEALGDDTGEVTMVATDEHGRNPSRIMTLLDGFRGGSDRRRVLGVAETVSMSRRAAALAEAQFAESVLNSTALQMWSMSVICPYDTGSLDETRLTEMRRSHPVIRGEADANPDYDERLASKLYGRSLPHPPAAAASLELHSRPQLNEMRDFVRTEATRYGIAEDRVDDLVLAVNEIGTNSVRHGGGRCTVRMWSDDGSAVCEVSDHGYLRNPLLGRFAPKPEAPSGRGLWLSNHLCDLVQIRSSEAGTVVRLIVDP